MNPDFINRLFQKHANKESVPHSDEVYAFADGLLEFMFPALNKVSFRNVEQLAQQARRLSYELHELLITIESRLNSSLDETCKSLLDKIPDIYELLLTDIKAIEAGDPAAKNESEVVRAYPGFYAIAMYRIAHEMEKLDIPMIPRMLTEHAHTKTGIDIHPGADIGPFFCIDHGTGIVIGETTNIGKHVKLYQGVTLGALSVDKDMASTKRHPTLEDHVVIYAGATILGGKTVIGQRSVVGGNVWLTKSLPADSTVYHKASIQVHKAKELENNQ